MAIVIEVDPDSSVPPYEQIRDQVVAGVAAGVIAMGTRLPTVRQLAGDLGLAVNTVAKAYRHLEAEGHVATRGRNGTVVLAPRAGAATPSGGPRIAETSAAAEQLVRAAQRSGLDLDETIGLLRQAW